MALGIKIKKVVTKNPYTVEEFYEAIKDHAFEAGTPQLTKHGFANIITFPALDRYNQVWIAPMQTKNCTKWQISKQEEAGLSNAAVNMALSSLTDGLSNLRGMASKNTKECERLVVAVTDELNAMGL